MSNYRNSHTGLPNPSDKYEVIVLEVDTWQSVELPVGTRVIASTADGPVAMREASDAVVPEAEPAGEGSIMTEVISLAPYTTHIHIYELSGEITNLYINYYEG